MNALLKLCEQIEMPKEAVQKMSYALCSAEAQTSAFEKELCDRTGYERAALRLHEYLGEDENGWKILAVMLNASLFTLKKYRVRGISDEVFYQTMKCFSRFVREHKTSYGAYGFDRWLWTGRQLSLSLFRLGELEYELAYSEQGERAIAIHIPSDADLSARAVDKSLAESKTFFGRFEPKWANTPYTCSSWLLAPALKELLPSQSNIVNFQNRFSIVNVSIDNLEYRTWLFHGQTQPRNFAEDTSLQRAAKAFVLGGGKIGSAFGILKND